MTRSRPGLRAILPCPEEPPLKGKSGRERSREWRDRILSDPEKRESFLEQERQRQKTQRLKKKEVATDEEKQKQRENARLRKQKQRIKEKAKKGNLEKQEKPTTRLDGQRLQEKRKVDAERKKEWRKNLDGRKRAAINRKRMMNYYAKKEAEMAELAEKACMVDLNEGVNENADNQVFKSHNAFKKCLSRIKKNIRVKGAKYAQICKALLQTAPKDSRQALKDLNISDNSVEANRVKGRLAVLSKKRDKGSLTEKKNLLSLFSEEELREMELKTKKKSQSQCLYSRSEANVTAVAVKKFFEESSSYMADKKAVDKRKMKPRKVLSKPIRLVYSDFIKKFPEKKVSLRTFFRYRPRYVLSVKKVKRNTCLCDICENVKLKSDCVNKLLSCSLCVKEWLDKTLCPYDGNIFNVQCAERKCSVCGVVAEKRRVERALKDKLNETVVFRADKVERNKKKKMLQVFFKPLRVLIEDFFASLHSFSQHRFTALWQGMQYRTLISKPPLATAVMCLDFSENYRCSQQNEIASNYYSCPQVMVHPVVSHFLCSCGQRVTDYKVFYSNDLTHDSFMVKEILDESLKTLPEELKRIIIFSDGASAQYKSRVPFLHFTQLESSATLERAFFGSCHGKNPCDACGGVVKSQLDQAVVRGQLIPQNAESIFTFSKRNLGMSVISSDCQYPHVRRSFHLVKCVHRKPVIECLRPVDGIRKMHSVRAEGVGDILFRKYACFCTTYILRSDGPCQNQTTVGSWSRKTFLKGHCDLNEAFIDPPRPFPAGRSDYFLHFQGLFSGVSSFEDLSALCKSISVEFDMFGIDESSEQVQAVDHDALALPFSAPSHLLPIKVLGDGNCLPRSLSMICFGNEGFFVEVRLRIAMELALFCDYYTDKVFLARGTELDPDAHGTFIACPVDRDITFLEVFKRDVLAICKDREYMSFGNWLLQQVFLKGPYIQFTHLWVLPLCRKILIVCFCPGRTMQMFFFRSLGIFSGPQQEISQESIGFRTTSFPSCLWLLIVQKHLRMQLRLQNHLHVPLSLQNYLHVPLCLKNHLHVPLSLQNHLHVPLSLRNHLHVPLSLQNHLHVLLSLQNHLHVPL